MGATMIVMVNLIGYVMLLGTSRSCEQFKITHFEYCSSNMGFRILYGKSLSDCAFECDIRPRCDAINYRKRRLQCELLAYDNSTSFVPSSDQIGPCVYIHRTDIYINALSKFCGNSCYSGEVCDIELNKCIIKECPPLSLANGTTFGNMYKVGSRLKIKCNDGYVGVGNNMYTVCDASGEWYPSVRCQSIVTNQEFTSTSISISSTVATQVSSLYECTFERNICEWTQSSDDQFDWKRHNGKTPTSHTGPKKDHTYGKGNGYYIYIETSSPRECEDKARLISPNVNTTTSKCLGFWYHMDGRDVNMLNVYLQVGNTLGTPVWTKTGEVNNEWHSANVDIQSNMQYSIVFEGVAGDGNRGDIALDDLSVSEGSCG